MDLLIGTIYLLSRYIHIVCTTLIVGGTLFFEMVVPVAIADLKAEHQLAIFARARWMFRQIVWACAIALVVSGVVSTRQVWGQYTRVENIAAFAPGGESVRQPPSVIERPGWWWTAHVSTGSLAVLIALSLTIGGTPPGHPVAWMRLNLVILMIVIFLGSATRQMRFNNMEDRAQVMGVRP